MCGIHGIVALAAAYRPDPEVLQAMGRVTVHRGPDDAGVYSHPRLAMGMRRLAIIDLNGGHQPISNHDDTLWLVCNGEIYNFRPLRAELEGRGHRFKTHSDSEVILHAYAEWGDRFIDRIDGMFAFGLWDEPKKRLIIARDRIGIKPLYYCQDQERLIFASEAKAILEVPGVEASVDPVALHQYLALGYAPAPYSMFAGIKKLPVATMMVVEEGKVSLRRYWRLSGDPMVHLDEKAWTDRVVAKIESAVADQMVSDVPLGAFLSGGIDSSCIVGLMAKHSDRPVKTYSIGFDGAGAGGFYNELPYAKQVSQAFGTEHKEILVRPNVVELLPRLLWHMDEPIADSAFITTFLVAEFARRDVTVILSGVGGDELFGGYRRYLGEYYGELYRYVPRRIRGRLILPLAKRLPSDRHSKLLNYSRLARRFLLASELPFEERYRSYVGVYGDAQLERLMVSPPEESFDALGAAFSDRSLDGDSLRSMFEVDMATQMPDDLLLLTDKMTMATSIECRVPLLDTELVELAYALPSRYKIHGRELKYILKKAFSGFLPDEILYRKKRGFGAPMGAWIKNELQGLTHYLLSPDSVKRRGLLSPEMVQESMMLHESNQEDHTDHLLAMLFLEVWCRLYLDKQSPSDLSLQIQKEARV
jgi:asparagine synthase (glutamine-hydrolysing)